MSRLQLTSWQRKQLRRHLTETLDARVLRRTLAVLEFDRGRSVAELARMLGVSRQTVYNWIDTYMAECNPATLEDQPGRGRPTSLNEDEEHLLGSLLGRSPQLFGFPHSNWTIPLLREALEGLTERRVSDDTLRRTLHRLNYVWKRPRYDLIPDPEREKKTPDSPANRGPSAAERRAGPRRNRPVDVPAPACRLVEAWPGGPRLAERP